MIRTGRKAPEFTLRDHEGQEVGLADLAGRWVVLYFYPRDATPGCTVEAVEFTREIEDFHALGAVVCGCSPDSPESHARFIDQHGLKVVLLSDPDRSVMRKFGAFGEKIHYGRKILGVIRSTVILDPEGRIAHHWASVRARGHAAAVRKILEQLVGAEAGKRATGRRASAGKASPKGAKKAAKKGAKKTAKKTAHRRDGRIAKQRA
ncbi:MAG: hypothetical protein Fur0037_19930 [Planctomycetota bacterium]